MAITWIHNYGIRQIRSDIANQTALMQTFKHRLIALTIMRTCYFELFRRTYLSVPVESY